MEQAVKNEIKSVQLKNLERFIPAFVGGGDRELDGHGPKIMVNVLIYAEEYSIRARMNVFIQETKSDWSTGFGCIDREVFRNDKPILRIVGATESEYTIDMKGTHDSENISVNDGVVKNYTFWGDRKGNDIGEYSSVAVEFVTNVKIEEFLR